MAFGQAWLPGFNFNVEEWDAEGQTYETLAKDQALVRQVLENRPSLSMEEALQILRDFGGL